MEINIVAGPEIPADVAVRVNEEIKALIAGAKIDRVENEEQANLALQICKECKVFGAGLETMRKDMVSPFTEKVKNINAFFKSGTTITDRIEDNVKSVIRVYQNEIEKKRIEAHNAAVAAKKKADDEQREYERKIEEQKKESAEKMPWENEPEPIVPPVPQKVEVPSAPEIYKPKGLSNRVTYHGEITDRIAFLKWAFKNEHWGLIAVDQKALDKLTKALGENFKADGAVAVPETISSLRI